MKKSPNHSKGKAIVKYLGVIALVCATAVIDDVALGFLSNMQAYVKIQPVTAAASASVSSPSTYALSGTTTSYRQ